MLHIGQIYCQRFLTKKHMYIARPREKNCSVALSKKERKKKTNTHTHTERNTFVKVPNFYQVHPFGVQKHPKLEKRICFCWWAQILEKDDGKLWIILLPGFYAQINMVADNTTLNKIFAVIEIWESIIKS